MHTPRSIRFAPLLFLALHAVAIAGGLPRCVDTSVAGIAIKDPASAEAVVGREIALVEDDLLYALYTNNARSEQLRLIFHPGDIRHSFSEFEVKGVRSPGRGAKVLSTVSSFRTAKGIHLGMSKREVMAVLGKPKGNSRAATLEYRLDDIASTPFLQRYNMPIYYGRYRFKGNRLVEYAFGFEYP